MTKDTKFRPAMRLLMFYAVLLAAILLITFSLLTFLPSQLGFDQSLMRVAWKAIVIAGACFLLYGFLWRITSLYTVSEEAVSANFGILSRKRIQIPLNRVIDYQIITPFIERLLFLGSVHLDTAGEEDVIMWQLHRSETRVIAQKLDALLKK